MEKKKVKELCSHAADCQSAGEDCTEEGRAGREGGCFESVDGIAENGAPDEELAATGADVNKSTEEEEDGPSFCTARECPSHDATTLNGCTVLEHVYECDRACDAFEADASASIPAVTESAISPDTSQPFTKLLPVHLSADELSDHAEEMARLIGLHTKASLDLKAYTRGAKKVIEDYENPWREPSGRRSEPW